MGNGSRAALISDRRITGQSAEVIAEPVAEVGPSRHERHQAKVESRARQRAVGAGAKHQLVFVDRFPGLALAVRSGTGSSPGKNKQNAVEAPTLGRRPHHRDCGRRPPRHRPGRPTPPHEGSDRAPRLEKWHNRSHRTVRARVKHACARIRTWKTLRDCRLKGDGVHHAMPGIARLYNLTLAGWAGNRANQHAVDHSRAGRSWGGWCHRQPARCR